PITNLPDSNTFAAQLKEHVKNAKDRGKQETLGSLSFIALDSFSRFTARFGRVAGEALVRRTAGLLSQACQAGELAACLGKDRFAVLTPRATDAQTRQWYTGVL